jgi:hypothetical protein
MPRTPTNQKEKVAEDLGARATARLTLTTEKIHVPGIKTLHLKPTEEVAAVLANIIKSRNAVKAITYNVGDSIEVTSESDLSVG